MSVTSENLKERLSGKHINFIQLLYYVYYICLIVREPSKIYSATPPRGTSTISQLLKISALSNRRSMSPGSCLMRRCLGVVPSLPSSSLVTAARDALLPRNLNQTPVVIDREAKHVFNYVTTLEDLGYAFQSIPAHS